MGPLSAMTPVIYLKLATAATCEVPECEYYLLGRAKNRSPGVAKVKHVLDKEVILAPIPREQVNLPIFYNSFVSSK